jgi:hypothetical protein
MPLLLPCVELCGAQGWVCWEEVNDPISGPWDHDVVECFTVLALPVIPWRAFHTFNWSVETHLGHIGPHLHLATDSSFEAYPLRLSGGLIVRAFLRRWLWLVLPAGLIVLIKSALVANNALQVALLSLGIGAVFLSITAVTWLKMTESRARKIRRLLGRHRRGSRDPATWTAEDCGASPDSTEMFDSPSYAAAVEPLLEKGNYSGAMWAARLTVAREDRAGGEALTNRILSKPRVKSLLASAEENPKAWLAQLRTAITGPGD